MKQPRKKQIDIEAESRRRTQQVLEDEDAMRGINESLEEVRTGERGVRLSELKRKLARARRVSS